MKVKELIEELKGLDPEMVLMHQSDTEGNSFMRLGGAKLAFFNIDGYGLTVHSLKWSAKDCGLDEEEYKRLHASKENQCLVFYPGY